MPPGKLLFERLEQGQGWTLESSIERSVQQLASTQFVRDSEAPPGVLNYGLPNPVDFGIGGGELQQFADLLQQRIVQFEPRCGQVDVSVHEGRLLVQAVISGSEEILRWWI